MLLINAALLHFSCFALCLRTNLHRAAVSPVASRNATANHEPSWWPSPPCPHPPVLFLRGGSSGPIRAASQGPTELWHVGLNYLKFPVYPPGSAALGGLSVRKPNISCGVCPLSLCDPTAGLIALFDVYPLVVVFCSTIPFCFTLCAVFSLLCGSESSKKTKQSTFTFTDHLCVCDLIRPVTVQKPSPDDCARDCGSSFPGLFQLCLSSLAVEFCVRVTNYQPVYTVHIYVQCVCAFTSAFMH